MAYPVIVASDASSGAVTTASSNWTLSWPGNTSSGQLVLAFVSSFSTDTGVTWGTSGIGTLATVDRGSYVTLTVGYLFTTDALSGTFEINLAAAHKGVWRAHRITGVDIASLPEATVANYNTSTPNPPSLTVSGDTDEYLWIATCGVSQGANIVSYPTGYNDNQSADVGGSTDMTTLGISSLNYTGRTQDPGAFSISDTTGWGAATIAVYPGAAIPDPITIPCVAGSLVFAGKTATVTPGAVTVYGDVPASLIFAGVSAIVTNTPPARTVNCVPGGIVLSGQAATVTPGAVNISCSVASLTFTGISASLKVDETISCSVGTFVLSGQTTTIVPGAVSVACAVGSLVFTGNAASVINVSSVTINATVGTLIFSGQSAAVSSGVKISCAVGALVFLGQAASIIPGAVSVSCSAGALALSGQSASIVPGAVSVTASASSLIFSGQAASVIPGAVSITVNAGSVVFAGQTASISIISGIIVNANTGRLTFAGLAAIVSLLKAVDITLSDAEAYTLIGTEMEMYALSMTDAEAYTLSVSDSEMFGLSFVDNRAYKVTLGDS